MFKKNKIRPVLPAIYDESLSYYEVLCKVLYKLQTLEETVEENKRNIEATVEENKRDTDNSISSLDSAMSQVAMDIGDITESVQVLRDKVSSLEDRVTALENVGAQNISYSGVGTSIQSMFSVYINNELKKTFNGLERGSGTISGKGVVKCVSLGDIGWQQQTTFDGVSWENAWKAQNPNKQYDGNGDVVGAYITFDKLDEIRYTYFD